MALSTQEHALLVETCTNMNVAANTCREVLEMLRSLGNTGVVDIATHNNAATAHADATNLAHIVAGKLVHGPLNAYGSGVSSTSGNYPVTIGLSNFQTYVYLYGEKHNSRNDQNLFRAYMALTDSNKDGLTLSQALSSYGGTYTLASIEGIGAGTDGNVSAKITLAGLSVGSRTGREKTGSIEFFTTNASGTSVLVAVLQDNALIPYETMSLGTSDNPWDAEYFRTAATITSDLREKDNIGDLDAKAVALIKALRPVQYTVKNGGQNVLEADENGLPTKAETIHGTRTHWGFIAQDVRQAMTAVGIEDAAVWCLADKDDPDSHQALRYEELIAPMIKVIQQQQERIEALERKVA